MTVSRFPLETEVSPSAVFIPSPASSTAPSVCATTRGALSFAAFVAFVALAQGATMASAEVMPPPLPQASALAKPASSREVPAQAQVALERGRQLQKSGETTLAEAQFRSALAMAPQLGAAHRELARLLTSQCRWAEAKSEWNSVLALSSSDQEAKNTLLQIERRTASPSNNGQPTLAQPQTRSSAETRPRPSGMKPTPAAPKVSATPQASPATKATSLANVTPPRIAQAAPTATPSAVSAATPAKTPLTIVALAPTPRNGVRPRAAPPQAPPLKLDFRAPKRKKLDWRVAKKAYIYVNEGALLLKSKPPQAEQALRAYKLGYATDPYNPYAASGIATSLLVAGKFDEAAKNYALALAILPSTGKNAKLRADAQRGLADTLTYGKHYNQALQANNTILALRPNDFLSLYQVAQIYTYTNQYDKARTFYERTLAAFKPSPRLKRAQVLASYGEALTYAGETALAQKQLQAALKLEPNNPDIRRSLANAALYGGDYAQAVTAYRAVLALLPKDMDAHLGLGEALTFADKPELSINIFKAALLLKSKDQNDAKRDTTRAHLGLGRAYVTLRRFREALPELNTAVYNDPENEDALLLLAVAKSETGDLRGALAIYQKLLNRTTLSPAQARDAKVNAANINASIGDLQARAGDTAAADQAYIRARQLAPQDSGIALRYAAYLSGQRRYAEARTIAQGVLGDASNKLRANILLLAIETQADNKERAADLARQLVDTNATDLNLDDGLLLVFALHNAGQKDASAQLLADLVKRTEARSATDPNPITAPTAKLRLADAARDTEQFKDAIALYGEYLAQNPNDADARIGLATTLSYDKQLDAAQSEVRRVLDKQTDANDAQIQTATLLAATIASYRGTPESLEEAQSRFLAALAGDLPPAKRARALSGLGFTLSARGHYPEAIERYQAALALEPGDAEALLGLARNLNYARRPAESIVQYEQLLRRAPQDNDARLELARIYLDTNDLANAERLYDEVIAVGGHYRLSAALYIPAPTQKFVAFQPAPQFNPSRVLPLLRRVDFAPKSRHKAGKPLQLRLAQAAPDSSGAGQTGGGAVGTPGGGTPTTPATPSTTPDGGQTPTNGPAPPGGTATNTGVPPVVPQGNTPLGTTPPVSGVNGLSGPTVVTPKEERAALRGLAEVRRRQLRYEEAVALFRQVIADDTQSEKPDITAQLGLAQALRGQEDYATALTEVESLLNLTQPGQDPAPPNTLETRAQLLTARVLRAQLLSDVGRTAEAQSELDSLAQGIENASPPPTLDNYLSLSQAFASVGNYDASLAILARGQSDYANEPALMQRKGELLLAAKRYDEARTTFNQLLATNKNDVDAQLGVARSYNYSNRLVEAEAAYRAAIQIISQQSQDKLGSVTARLELADVLSRRGEYPESISLYQAAILDAPKNLGARVELARVLRYNRRYTDALDVLNQVLVADGRNVPALTERGILRGQTGDYEPGLADLREALRIAPDDLNAQLGVAEVLSYQGNYEESVRLYRAALERDPSNQKARVELGLALSYSGQNAEALKEINSVLQTNPNNLDAQIARASSLGRAHQYPESIAAFKTILVRSPNSQRAQLGLAEAYVAAGQFNNAISAYDVLLRLEPDNVNYAVARAQSIGYAGRTSEAVSALQSLLKTNPGNLRARLALAEAMTNSRNRNLRAAAIREYRSILEAQPSNVSARFGLGRALSYQGDYSGADRELSTVLKSQPNNSEALYELAQAQRLGGNPFDARDNYKRALAVDKNSERARAGLDLVSHQTAPGITPFYRYYRDTNGAEIKSYGIGPTVPFRFGTIGASYETGSFTDEGVKLQRHAVNLLLSRSRGSLEARLLISGVDYSNVDDGTGTRFLYDAFLQKSDHDGRRRIGFTLASREVIESLGSVNFDIRAQNYGINLAYPLGRFDAEGTFTRLHYSDSNNRNIATAALLYRILDNTRNGTFRVGIGQRYENTKFQPARYFNEPLYYAPQNFNSTSILADYQIYSNKLRLGIYGAYPLTNSQGDNGFGRPAKTVFGNVTYYPNRFLELFANGGIVRSPDFDSNQVTGGITFRFN